jgi:predicted ferric reductase
MVKITSSPPGGDTIKLKIYRTLLIVLLFLIIGGGLSIPFVYESQTLWYKIGIDKTLLQGGKMAGLAAAILLFIQILLATRGKLLKDLFGIAALMRWHRINGVIISILVIGHATLILMPEGLTNLPIGKKYWPEMIGILMLCIVLFMSVSSSFREKLKLDYKRWKTHHKRLGYLVVILLGVHVLFVSESFEHTVPRLALVTILAAVVAAVVLTKKNKWLST